MPKYTYIGPMREVIKDGKVIEELPANCMGGNKLSFGDIVEFDGVLAKKADMMPDNYEKVKPGPKPKEQREEQFGVSAKDKKAD